MKSPIYLLFAMICISCLSCKETTTQKDKPVLKFGDSLRYRIDAIAQTAKGKVGVAIMNLETGDTLSYNGHMHLPMQSTFKFPIAIAVLQKVDSNKLSLKQVVNITEKEMDEDTWSPLQDKYPDGADNIALNDLLSYMISQSDNIACDEALKLLGGPSFADSCIHQLSINGMAIKASEAAMHRSWDVQYTNWCEPWEMLRLLDLFYKGKTLSKASTELLMKMMLATSTGPNRIRGLLPPNTIVANKTGTGGTNFGVMTSATNDLGIITLPDGQHLAIVVFVSDFTTGVKNGELVIAKIARAAYDEAVKK